MQLPAVTGLKAGWDFQPVRRPALPHVQRWRTSMPRGVRPNPGATVVFFGVYFSLHRTLRPTDIHPSQRQPAD